MAQGNVSQIVQGGGDVLPRLTLDTVHLIQNLNARILNQIPSNVSSWLSDTSRISSTDLLDQILRVNAANGRVTQHTWQAMATSVEGLVETLQKAGNATWHERLQPHMAPMMGNLSERVQGQLSLNASRWLRTDMQPPNVEWLKGAMQANVARLQHLRPADHHWQAVESSLAGLVQFQTATLDLLKRSAPDGLTNFQPLPRVQEYWEAVEASFSGVMESSLPAANALKQSLQDSMANVDLASSARHSLRVLKESQAALRQSLQDNVASIDLAGPAQHSLRVITDSCDSLVKSCLPATDLLRKSLNDVVANTHPLRDIEHYRQVLAASSTSLIQSLQSTSDEALANLAHLANESTRSVTGAVNVSVSAFQSVEESVFGKVYAIERSIVQIYLNVIFGLKLLALAWICLILFKVFGPLCFDIHRSWRKARVLDKEQELLQRQRQEKLEQNQREQGEEQNEKPRRSYSDQSSSSPPPGSRQHAGTPTQMSQESHRRALLGWISTCDTALEASNRAHLDYLPLLPPWRCEECKQDRAAADLIASLPCPHRLEAVFKLSFDTEGPAYLEAIAKERRRWHPDKFMRCSQSFRLQYHDVIGEMSKGFNKLYDEEIEKAWLGSSMVASS
ncbi:MAG: hypothetical protein M1828_005696 [Chrysothrix sp. TS-e1954]|nr:MAG: hypothetical protein M1828_005696 [Chrysothrix sp. TS-e1954]